MTTIPASLRSVTHFVNPIRYSNKARWWWYLTFACWLQGKTTANFLLQPATESEKKRLCCQWLQNISELQQPKHGLVRRTMTRQQGVHTLWANLCHRGSKPATNATCSSIHSLTWQDSWDDAYLMYLTRSSAQAKPPSTASKFSWPLGGSPLSAKMFCMPISLSCSNKIEDVQKLYAHMRHGKLKFSAKVATICLVCSVYLV